MVILNATYDEANTELTVTDGDGRTFVFTVLTWDEAEAYVDMLLDAGTRITLQREV